MSHDPSRKRFLASALGLAAVGALAPGAAAGALLPAPTNKEGGRAAAFRLRPQDRAIARRDGAPRA